MSDVMNDDQTRTTITISREILEEVKAEAHHRRVSMATFMREAIGDEF